MDKFPLTILLTLYLKIYSLKLKLNHHNNTTHLKITQSVKTNSRVVVKSMKAIILLKSPKRQNHINGRNLYGKNSKAHKTLNMMKS